MMVVMVDKMLKTQIVECASVANWIFSKEMSTELTSFYVWEILHSTVNRMGKQVEKIRNEYKQLVENSKKSSGLDSDMVSFISLFYDLFVQLKYTIFVTITKKKNRVKANESKKSSSRSCPH